MIPYLLSKTKTLPVFLFLFFSVEAQKITPVIRQMYTEAEEFMLVGEYKEALPLYINLYNKGFTTANINFKIGECYLNIPGQKDKALPYLEKTITKISPSFTGKDLTEENAPLVANLYLGIAYRIGYQFDKARKAFLSLQSVVDTTDDQIRMLLEYHIKRCQNAEDLMRSPALVTKDRLPGIINDGYSNANPLLTKDENTIFYMNHYKFYDAIMQSVREGNNWQNPVNLTPVVKSDGDQFITGISEDGKTMLLTAYDPYNSGEIYSSRFIDGKWTPITKLNSNINTRFNETHASYSADGKTLYFTSDRKGGIGGLDIYQSEMIDGDWGPAVNLGPVINTIFDEETPFLTYDGKKLFFSSQGHYNMGGFDVFYSEKKQDTWSSPVNIGYPVNTPDDELFWFPVDSGMHAYMPVIDNETRQSDIYRFAFEKSANPARYTLNGQLEPAAGSKEITVSFIEKESKDTVASQQLDNEGRFQQKLPQGNYKVSFCDAKGNVVETREINIPRNFPQDKFILTARIIPEDTAQAIAGSQIAQANQTPDTGKMAHAADTLWLENILFSFDKSTLPASCFPLLNSLADFMDRYPGTLLQITGFTDAIGREDYNLKLSMDRAMAVAGYLQKKHINPSRLTIKGLGESMPVALNSNPDGTDNPTGRKFNRRVEIQITLLPEEWILITKDIIPPALRNR
jgi:outer membrane protein OmpA-like peptidoglycan-associated protein/YHS domain-containing protein